jgi:hypothetical protein
VSLLVVRDGALVTQDPNDVRVYIFDWDTDNLAEDVTISSHTFTITRLRGAASPALSKDSEAILTAWTDDAGHDYGALRTTRVRLSGGALGAVYRIDETIVTSESPAQTKERSFRLSIQQK